MSWSPLRSSQSVAVLPGLGCSWPKWPG